MMEMITTEEKTSNTIVEKTRQLISLPDYKDIAHPFLICVIILLEADCYFNLLVHFERNASYSF